MSQSKKKPGGAKKDRGAPATPPQEEVAPNSKKKDKAPAPSPRLSRPSSLLDTRVIYCGDNLEQLAKLPPACVDLIYIDPPFNSNRNYEVFWGETKEKRSFEDRHASTQAYTDYMRPRCLALSKVMKPTGTMYYHCDRHASHYVKVMLDQIFGENNFQSEIIWKRTHAHGSAKRWAPIHDSIFMYSGSKEYTWTYPTVPHDFLYIRKHFRMSDPPPSNRPFQPITLTGSGTRNGESGKSWRGIDPTDVGRHWALPGEVMERYKLTGATLQARLDALDGAGLIYWPKEGEGTPRLKWYADELGGMAMGTVWTDIAPISANAAERLGYPTQKPLALLERIINASSNPNDIVLDAFCGCGTALVAAQNLGRQWIGIDISPTACRVMAKRLRDVCNLPEKETLWRAGRGFVVRELPFSAKQLRAMPAFEFENWAVIGLGGVPNKVQVGDMGIDGRIFPVGTKPSDQNSMFAGDWFPVQVKQTERVGRPDIDQFEAVMTREDRQRGFFVAFGYSSDAEAECEAFRKKSGRIIKLISVQEILDEQLSRVM